MAKADKKPAEKKPAEKTPAAEPAAAAEKKPKAGKKLPKEPAGAGDKKKKRSKKNVETYKIYIFKVLKQVHPGSSYIILVIWSLKNYMITRWAAIAKQMPNRTDNDIKNHWNSCLKKRLAKKGIDPMTHEPTTTTSLTVDVTSSSTTSSPTPSPTSSSFSSCSSTGSARFLNKLAAGISSRKHGLVMTRRLASWLLTTTH